MNVHDKYVYHKLQKLHGRKNLSFIGFYQKMFNYSYKINITIKTCDCYYGLNAVSYAAIYVHNLKSESCIMQILCQDISLAI